MGDTFCINRVIYYGKYHQHSWALRVTWRNNLQFTVSSDIPVINASNSLISYNVANIWTLHAVTVFYSDRGATCESRIVTSKSISYQVHFSTIKNDRLTQIHEDGSDVQSVPLSTDRDSFGSHSRSLTYFGLGDERRSNEERCKMTLFIFICQVIRSLFDACNAW